MADVIEYRSRLEKERRAAIGDPVVISMRNQRDEEFKKLQAKARDRQLITEAASALRKIYMTHGNSLMADVLRAEADLEARKILNCGNE